MSRGGVAWRRAGRGDLPALAAFLAPREERCAGFTGRLLKGGELRLPASLSGGVWIAEVEGDGALLGALLCHPLRLAFPLLPGRGNGGPESGTPAAAAGIDASAAALEALAAGIAARRWSAAQAIGPATDVIAFEAACGYRPKIAVAYDLMATRGAPAVPAAPRPGGLRVREAAPRDAKALLPLQEAYELEEVLTPLHGFDRNACRLGLERALSEQLVYVAEEGGAVVGKAGTNSRGFAVDQVGGVYVVPERRGRGIGRALMDALLGRIRGESRRPTLFVKPGNRAAQRLYRGLGFEKIDDYRADYFEV